MEELRVTGTTKMAGLIGGDVSHSSSPTMHSASFAHMGYDCMYLPLSMPGEKLGDAFAGMRAMGFVGCNVTMPHKTAVLEYLDELTPAAQLMGAVNTVEFAGGKAIGHNTDGAGFTRNLADHGFDIKGATITVVGGGGAGSAVFTQAALDGAAVVHVFNIRDAFFGSLEGKLRQVEARTGAKMHLHDLADREELRQAVAASTLFVNATRVGMAPDVDGCTLPEEFLHEGLAVADTVYIPRETKLLRMAREHGNKAISGIGMLLWQASLAERIWTGKDMDIPYIDEHFFAA